MLTMQPIKTNKGALSEQIAFQVLDLITASSMEAGSRLPSIEQLAAELEVSQASVREAIKLLNAWGAVTVRHGSGVYVAAPMESTLTIPFRMSAGRSGRALHKLHQIREALEPDIAALAARDHQTEHLKKIEAALRAMDLSIHEPETYLKADLEFHTALAESTGNELFLIVIHPIIDLMEEGKRLASQSPRMLERAQTYHWRIYEKIKERIADEAYGAMCAHLEESWKEIQRHSKMNSPIELKQSSKGLLSDQVVNKILDFVASNRLKEGDRLPPVEELCAQLGVSRTPVREAIKLLDAWGVITVKHGIGIFVSGPIKDTLKMPLKLSIERSEKAIIHLHQLREALEPDIAALAALNAQAKHIQLIEQTIRSMEECMDAPDCFIVHDLAFHSALAEATGNDLFLIVIHSVVDLLQDMRNLAVSTPGAPVRAQQYHLRILENILARDPDGARQEMKAHLAQAWSEIQAIID
jgi:GntR family transcriptional repressor for pyruvate dehydrogenase complex